jgi:hypothetical protein
MYLAEYVITFYAFEGRAGVCLGILPGYVGVAKAIEKGKKESKLFLHNYMMDSRDSMTCDLKSTPILKLILHPPLCCLTFKQCERGCEITRTKFIW